MMMDASEKIMALVDGQLDPAEAPALIQELARNSALVRELQGCLATTRARIARLYEPKSLEPVPSWLVDTVMGTNAAPAVQPVRQFTYSRTLLGCLKNRYRVPGWSLAAAPAMAAMLVAAAGLALPTWGYGREVEAGMRTALEKTNGGKDFALASLRPVLTFKNNEGAWCRQFEVRYGTQQISYALACRTDVGHWPVVAATSPVPQPAGSSHRPVGDENPRKAIDDRVMSTIDGSPVIGEEESELVKNGWRPLRG